MEIPWTVVLAVLGGALLHACWNTLVKSSADKQLDSMAVAAGAGLVSQVVAPFLPPPDPASWPWLAISTVVHIGYFTVLARAYHWGDLSFTYPIMRGGGPVIVAVAGVLVFGEILADHEALGVALICTGVLAFATHVTRDPEARRKSLMFALLNAAIIATYTLVDAVGARRSGAPVSYAMWFFVASGLVVFLTVWLRRRGDAPRYVVANWRRVLLGGTCTMGSYAIALWAMTLAPVALVAALRETSVVFAAVLATVLLGEQVTIRRLAASAAILGGLILLRAPLPH
jgi:drug/metabolite transporter (DMT)-like permease